MRCLAIVRFPAPAGLTGAKLRAVLQDGVPRYQDLPGLHRKYFAGNVTHGGGIYEWESRAAADAFYNDAWRERPPSTAQYLRSNSSMCTLSSTTTRTPRVSTRRFASDRLAQPVRRTPRRGVERPQVASTLGYSSPLNRPRQSRRGQHNPGDSRRPARARARPASGR